MCGGPRPLADERSLAWYVSVLPTYVVAPCSNDDGRKACRAYCQEKKLLHTQTPMHACVPTTRVKSDGVPMSTRVVVCVGDATARGYGVTQILGGIAADRLGGARVLLVGLGLWSLAVTAIPAATSLSSPVTMLVVREGGGVSSPGGNDGRVWFV